MRKSTLITAIVIAFASATLGLPEVLPSNAFSPSATANPRIIYWPRTEVWRHNDLITVSSGYIETKRIAWSPSGRYLLIHGVVLQRVGGPPSVNTLIMDMENGTLAYSFYLNLWGLAFDDFLPFAFSPDETKIFYVTTASYNDWLPRICSVNLDGTGSTFITYLNSTSSYPTRPYLFDVTKSGLLIYTSCNSWYNGTKVYYTSRIWKHNLHTGEKSLVLSLEGPSQLITSLKVSKSGDKIAYAVGNEIYVVDVNGTEPARVTSVPSGKIVTFIDFASNGTMLTYSAVNGTIDESGGGMRYQGTLAGNITAVNLDGSNKRVILNDGYGLVWSPIRNSLAAYILFRAPDYFFKAPYLIDFTMPITPNPDSDGDGLSDAAEIRNWLCPIDPTDGDMDYDEDGLTNREEIEHGTNLLNDDFDRDGLSDGVEVKVFRTNPTKWDTDGDGISDGLETAAAGLDAAFVSVLPAGWIRMQLEWQNKRMYVSTNSSVLGVVFNSTSMALTVNVGGPDGTRGVANITIPIEMISSLSALRVTLDNQPIEFQTRQAGGYAQIHVQYHHSYHQLTAHLRGGGGIGGVDLTGILGYWWLILSVSIIAIASVIAAIIVKRG
ncbi:MAG: hypothetical protein NZ932_00080 [Candidatus Bathyarchaeota archaeon]|nr:hypothetical protein [Candidatus Bathyarchaeota archaeon]